MSKMWIKTGEDIYAKLRRELIKRKWVSLLVNHTPSEEDKRAIEILESAGYYVNTIPTGKGLLKPEARCRGQLYMG